MNTKCLFLAGLLALPAIAFAGSSEDARTPRQVQMHAERQSATEILRESAKQRLLFRQAVAEEQGRNAQPRQRSNSKRLTMNGLAPRALLASEIIVGLAQKPL